MKYGKKYLYYSYFCFLSGILFLLTFGIISIIIENNNEEMIEMLVFNLLQNVEYAPVIAYQWIASDKPLYEMAGFHLLSRLFAKGQEPNERGINEFLDQAATVLQGDNMGVKHAAINSVMRFCDFGEDFEKIARGALKGIVEI